MDAQQIHGLYLRVETIWRQEMHGFAIYDFLQILHRGGLGDAHLCSEIADAGRVAHPYDILHVDIIAEEPFLVVVDINHTYESIAVLTEVVQERRILTHRGI